jgi:hypothetical protein
MHPEAAAAFMAKMNEARARYPWANPMLTQSPPMLGDPRGVHMLDSAAVEPGDLISHEGSLPLFVKPLPERIAPEDIKYLHAKGALALPGQELQNALLKAYVEYVHPYMPLLELHDFLHAINSTGGTGGRVSLFLYQAVMFVAAAFVELKYLQGEGYSNRKNARKAFFMKTRVSCWLWMLIVGILHD